MALDESHNNAHTVGGRYRPFAEFAASDGFRVGPHLGPLTAESLAEVDILVTANARAPEGSSSAFPEAEVALLEKWVHDGGALLLIADHMPAAGYSADLAAAFGLQWADGFAMVDGQGGPYTFRREAGTLAAHPITDGRGPEERVDYVKSFTGSAFRAPKGASPLMLLGPGVIFLQPDVPWEFDESTPRFDAEGWLQGAAFTHGEGRVAAFGEATMFTSQEAGPRNHRVVIGLGSEGAEQNPRLLLNTLRWLAGADEGEALESKQGDGE
ncbi:MAG: hypothetical protein AAF481_08200 [Acidobacteriota bacterium]